MKDANLRGVVIFLLAGWSAALTSRTAGAQGFPPDEAARRMSVAEGLEVRLVAAEPMVRQPVAIEFDDRGRLWVIQYLQYPNPDGLKRVAVDRYSRTAYDRIPEPPPRGPKGADRITILEDTDGDGRADRVPRLRDRAEPGERAGLRLRRRLRPPGPYLLFYPDRDRDDRPDGDPEVLLSGFGMEDAHSVANSLTWGPDGWLYGLQGSTVTAKVRGIEFQQGVWRYHPRTRRFELFCEGGGNMWGLDFDRHGQLFASTNVGGFVMLHGVQGGYYWKSFGKHGPLHNPYTFGYFDHVRHDGVQRRSRRGRAACFTRPMRCPPAWRGRYIAADLLDHSIHAHEVERLGSTFKARQVGDVLRANDTWFAPSDLTLGPDGALYVADWHDRRTAHPDPDADWDRTNGRIFAITARGARPGPPRDRRPGGPDRRRSSSPCSITPTPGIGARRVACWRTGALRACPTACAGPRWTDAESRRSRRCGPCTAAPASTKTRSQRLLQHPDADVRAWSRPAGRGRADVSPARLAARLVEMAGTEPDVAVRAQLACTARRLEPRPGLELAYRLLRATGTATTRTCRSSCGGPWSGTRSPAGSTPSPCSRRPTPGDRR